MSRLERLREYARPTRAANWDGPGRDEVNIRRWSERATENSEVAPPATDKPIDLPSTTNRQMGMRSTKSAPRTSAEIDARMRGKDDLNTSDTSPYLRGIRREA